MDSSWAAHTPTSSIKFENSPTDSLLSTPSEMYPSLFGTDSSSTINPHEMMTPRSYSEEMSPQPGDVDVSALAEMSPCPETPGSSTPGSEKKQTKKRKSWGQVLPEPKTNLPPRKRAKTEDEKEQRRVERVLRNRRAAQSSRERKRQEVEGLEQRNKELEALLRQAQSQNLALVEELNKARRSSGVAPRASTSFDQLRPATSVTFSPELFRSQDGHNLAVEDANLAQLLNTIPANTTINPTSLSPTLTPVPEVEEEEFDDEPVSAATPLADNTTPLNVSAFADTTQHPAAMLCEDLQCRSAEVAPSAWMATSQQQLHPSLALLLPLQFLLISTSAMLSLCQRPLTQIAMSLKAGFSLHPTPVILNTIIWLVTTPHSRTPTTTTSTSATTSPTTTSPAPSSQRSTKPSTARPQTRPSTTLRLKSLRKILTCSPTLARPLKDATMAALRLASTEGNTVRRVSGGDASADAAADGEEQRQQQRSERPAWLPGVALPSKEVLLTLLWALNVEERRKQIREQRVGILSSSRPGRLSIPKAKTPPMSNTDSYVLKVLPNKRNLGLGKREFPRGPSSVKRRRL
ncbi:hypothetical protein B0H63DRAFT_439304 [Podospora didyma]|uniref:BZIP domain-containing protein n=1 Tax=Podospora didyma TaxID=330526 RepID=A0AAE0N7D3_9PEZI|nr:hypothetical protein B0H63DRAFT_439304 [Podospora didyma]